MFSPGDAIGGSRYGAAQFGAPVQPTSSTPVTDLSMHVGGLNSGTANSVSNSSDTACMYWSAGLVIGAIGLLWLLGGVVFSSARQ